MNKNIIMYHTFLTCFVVLLSNQATRMYVMTSPLSQPLQFVLDPACS